MDMDDSDQEELDWDKDADSQDELSETNSKLGFRPQKRLPATFHLPYDVDLDREAADNLAKIKLNLAAALTANDLLGWQLYTQRLNKFISAYHLFMSKEDHVLLVQLYLQMLQRSPTDYRNIDASSKMVVRLLKKVKRHLTRKDLEIEWRPIYELYKSLFKHPYRKMKLNFFNEVIPRNVKIMARLCRSFFAASATAEILEELLPELCPFDSAATWVLESLEALLPTDLPPELYDSGWRLWLPQLTELLKLMENSGPWDQSLCLLFSRLALENPGHVQWDHLLPDVFSRLLRTFGLPISYKRASSPRPNPNAIPGLTGWVVGMLGGGSEVQSYLERLLEALQSYFYASNVGCWQEPLNRFLSHLCVYFVRRYNRERYKKGSWDAYTAEGHQLTDDDVTRFVKAVLPCALLGIYSWNHSHEANKCLRALAQLRPELVITPVIESFHQSLESITEPHRLTSTMNAVSSVLRTMTECGPRPEVVPLLQMLLPGIDPNDKLKTMCTFVLIDRLADMITFVDCSSAGDHPQLTEMEQQACVQTAGMEDVVLQLIGRFLALLEPNSLEGGQRPDAQAHQRVNKEEGLLLTVLRTACFSILNKSSPEIQRLALLKLRDHMLGRIMETRVSGKLAAVLVCGAILANPELGLKLFIPPVAQTVLEISADVQTEEKLDQELLFNMLLLKEMVSSCGRWLLPYRSLLEQVLERGRHLACLEGAELSGELLHNLLSALLGSYITDFGGWRRRLADTQNHHLLVREWGKCTDMRSLEVMWHIPSEEEVAWATQLVNKFIVPELDDLEQFMGDISLLNPEQLLCRLSLLQLGLKGASFGLPPIDEPTIPLWDSAVDLTPLRMETGAVSLPLEVNLRARTVQVLHRLVDTLSRQRPDDTKSLVKLVQVIQTTMFHFGVKGAENMAEMKILFTSRASQGKDFGPKKYSCRTLAAWVQLQHNQRILIANVTRHTSTLKLVIADLLRLATSQYHTVRQTAQSVLFSGAYSCCQGYMALYPAVVRMLQDPHLSHEQIKGLLYVVLGCGQRSLLRVPNWEVAAALWPALVSCASSEKDSIVALMERIRKETDVYEAVPIELTMSPSCLELVPRLWQSAPEPSRPPAPAALLPPAGPRLQQESEHNLYLYQGLLDKLLTLMESGELHWRRYELCLELLCLLVRPDVAASPRLVRFSLRQLLHTSIFVRKSALLLVGALLKQQKPVHPTLVVDPASISHRPSLALSRPLPADAGHWKQWTQFGEREDSLWLQYDLTSAPRSQEQWSQPRYIHKMKWGFAQWPRQLRLYQQQAEGCGAAHPGEAAAVVRQFFNDEGNVRQLVSYLSLEEHKGHDLFSGNVSLVFKGLFRNHGDAILEVMRPHMDRLRDETTESAQKCLAEIVAGLIRGCKHWSYAPVERMWQYLIPALGSCIARINQETANNWAASINEAVADRDPNRYHWLIEELMQPVFDREESLFLTDIRLHLLMQVIGEVEWRGAELRHRAWKMVHEHLDHPYQNIRHRIGAILGKVYHMDVYGGPATRSPVSEELIQTVLPQLDVLLTAEAPANGSNGGQGGGQSALGPVSEERQSAMRLLQTVCQYMLSCAGTHLLRFVSASHMGILPHLCVLESYDIDRDLQADCVRTLHVLAVLRHDAAATAALLTALRRVLQHHYWRVRVAGLAFLQATAFHNMFLLLRHAEAAQTVTECVMTGLHDGRVEVREMAVQVFSGLLHCGFIDKQRQNQLRSEFERMASTRLDRRGQGSRQPAQLRQRHTGVLGLCAFVNASPYDVPDHLPQTLMTLGDHVNDPPPIQTTIRKTMSNFKRTHHENWRLHKQKFTDDQLTVLTDLLVSPSYYA